MTDKPAPPQAAHERCRELLQRHRDDGRSWPDGMPTDLDQAVSWWLGVLEPPNQPFDTPRVVHSPSGDRWTDPYADRTTHCLRRFLRTTKAYQKLIVRAAEDGIPWRGDDEPAFRLVIDEHERMHAMGTEAYREETLAKLGRLRVNDSGALEA